MRYSFSMSPAVKQIAEWQLEHYRTEKQKMEEIRDEIIRIPITNYSLTGTRSGTESRPTEIGALNLVTAPYLRRMEIGIDAVDRTLARADEIDIDLITLVYWRKSHSVEGAALQCHISKSCAYKRLNDVLGCIAFEMGFINAV